MYSGINGDDVLIGDGSAVDLSEGGLGIRGNCPVNVGMELTLFLYLLDDEEPLFVSEATVAWTTGSLFGVEVKEVSLQDGDRIAIVSPCPIYWSSLVGLMAHQLLSV